jgi:hypothetical protein
VDLPIFGTYQRDLTGAAQGSPPQHRNIAWKAQVRLCARYRRLITNGKKTPVATTTIARELAAFLWAIGQQVAPQKLLYDKLGVRTLDDLRLALKTGRVCELKGFGPTIARDRRLRCTALADIDGRELRADAVAKRVFISCSASRFR